MCPTHPIQVSPFKLWEFYTLTSDWWLVMLVLSFLWFYLYVSGRNVIMHLYKTLFLVSNAFVLFLVFETWSCSVAQAGLELKILKFKPRKCWDYSSTPSCPMLHHDHLIFWIWSWLLVCLRTHSHSSHHKINSHWYKNNIFMDCCWSSPCSEYNKEWFPPESKTNHREIIGT
jgi:hypothetical protein